MRSDLVPGEEYTAIELTLLPVDGGGRSDRKLVPAQEQMMLELTQLAELDNLPSDTYRLGISLLSASGHALNERPILVDLKQNRAVSARIQRACLNVQCDEGFACLAGQCVDARCTVETPEFCGGLTVCGADVDCPAVAACGGRSCDGGLCWFTPKSAPDANACSAETSWCHPELGCLATTQALPDARCDDGAMNGDETGIDCGGTCNPCEVVLSPAVADHCVNGLQDQGEQGIDCGGTCTACEATCELQNDIPVHECLALAAFDTAAVDREWKSEGSVGESWFSDARPCSWDGIRCTAGRVTNIDLFPPSIGHGGSIPPAFGNLSELRTLDLTGMSLAGTVPGELSLLAKLESLVLSSNQLTGQIPASLSQLGKLETLDLSFNALSGSLAEELMQLTSLQTLRLVSNDLDGTLPATLGNLRELRTIDLLSNIISGSLPTSMGSLSKLESFRAMNNRIGGTLPVSLQNLSALQSFNINENRVGGTVPAWLARHPSLQRLELATNSFKGTLPSGEGAWAGFTDVALTNNALTGTLPVELFDSSSIKRILVNENLLEGTIPAVTTRATQLLLVYLSDNRLSGGLQQTPPPANLRGFHVDSNQLRGAVPDWFTDISDPRLGNNACLFVTDCNSLLTHLEAKDRTWPSENTDPKCVPPPEACP